MKKHGWLVAGICGLFFTTQLGATPIAYISGAAEPWGQLGNQNAMDNVFGARSWERLEFSTAVSAGIFGGGYEYLFLDGSAGNTSEWEAFVDGNRADLEQFVADGGNLFLNAARWGGTAGFDLGFGVKLTQGHSSTGHAASAGHAAFSGLPDGASRNFVGSGFSHDYLLGSGLQDILLDGNQRAILADMDFGAGHVMLGGLTLAFFGENRHWSVETGNLRDNIIALGRPAGYTASVRVAAAVPEPATLVLWCLGLIGMSVVRRTSIN